MAKELARITQLREKKKGKFESKKDVKKEFKKESKRSAQSVEVFMPKKSRFSKDTKSLSSSQLNPKEI